jgi:hypothetical protein
VLFVVSQVACGWDVLFGVQEKTVSWVQSWKQAAEVVVRRCVAAFLPPSDCAVLEG